MKHRHTKSISKCDKGFSLIELLVVLAIVAILTVVGVPSYSDHVRAQKRNVSKVHLLDIVSRQNQYLADNRQYASNLTFLGFSNETYGITKNGKHTAADSSEAIYVISLANTSNYTYSVVATPVNQQSQDNGCGTLSITSGGLHSASGDNAYSCW